jgi:hypothetical protein
VGGALRVQSTFVFSEANPETFSDDNLSQKAFVDNASNLSVAVRVAFESKL